MVTNYNYSINQYVFLWNIASSSSKAPLLYNLLRVRFRFDCIIWSNNYDMTNNLYAIWLHLTCSFCVLSHHCNYIHTIAANANWKVIMKGSSSDQAKKEEIHEWQVLLYEWKPTKLTTITCDLLWSYLVYHFDCIMSVIVLLGESMIYQTIRHGWS